MASRRQGERSTSTSRCETPFSGRGSRTASLGPRRQPTRYAHTEILRARAHRLIPGGAHTYAKGDDQYPVHAPGFIARGAGCRVWDVEGNEFIEYGMGLRAVTLGHAYPPVLEAAYRQMQLGSNFVRPAAIEVACAEALLELIDSAAMVKFAKDGSTVNTAAVRLARAFTGRDLIAVCAEDPFLSYNDWFIGSSEMPAGVPEAVRRQVVKFHYNDLPSVRAAFEAHPGRIACVIMEAMRTEPPRDAFLHAVQRLCREDGALFILDEMITGFRLHLNGAQRLFGLEPDLSCFGKALGNGFAISALVGRQDVMRLGGLDHDRERVFLLSTTHGAETHALAAAIETMRTYRRRDVIGELARTGERLRSGIQASIRRHGIDGYFDVLGHPSNMIYLARDAKRAPSQAFRTLFLQETTKRGLLMPSMVVSAAHGDADIDYTIGAIDEVLAVYSRALDDGVGAFLEGRPVKPVFRKHV